MKRLIVIAALLVSTTTIAQEKVLLTTPPPVTTEYRISSIAFHWNPERVDRCVINIVLASNVSSEGLSHSYGGSQACAMLRALNKADLVSRSLTQRIFDRLIADKIVVGTVSGNPE